MIRCSTTESFSWCRFQIQFVRLVWGAGAATCTLTQNSKTAKTEICVLSKLWEDSVCHSCYKWPQSTKWIRSQCALQSALGGGTNVRGWDAETNWSMLGLDRYAQCEQLIVLRHGTRQPCLLWVNFRRDPKRKPRLSLRRFERKQAVSAHVGSMSLYGSWENLFTCSSRCRHKKRKFL